MLPLMEEGLRFATARKRIYGDYAGSGAQSDLLPPVLEAVPQLRNPVVCPGPDRTAQGRQRPDPPVRQATLIRVELHAT